MQILPLEMSPQFRKGFLGVGGIILLPNSKICTLSNSWNYFGIHWNRSVVVETSGDVLCGDHDELLTE